MKKTVFLLLSLLLTMALLAGCGSAPAVTPAPETAPPQDAAPAAADAAAPLEAKPEETAAPAPEEAPPAGFLAEGRYFTLVLPPEWEGQVSVEERSFDGDYTMTFYHKQSHETEGAGRLFSLRLYDDTGFVGLPHYQAVGLLSDGEKEQYLIMDL